MLLQIDFTSFKNILNKNNILLFDTQYRIAHFRYNELIKNFVQIGGSKNTEPKQLINKINNYNPLLLSHFVDSLVSNNKNKINYIIEQIN